MSAADGGKVSVNDRPARVTPAKKVRRWLASLAAVLSAASAAAGSGAEGFGNLEAVGLDEVAPEDRAVAPRDTPVPPILLSPGPSRPGVGDLAEMVRGLWNAIPAYSPVNGSSRLTSDFGWRRSPFTGRREFHGGIDLAAARGTSIVAPADGIVERVFTDEASGRVLVLEHGNGMETVFGHLDDVLVAEGQGVRRGQAIAKLGSSGWRSTGPHLHYSIRFARKYVNPRRYLFEGRGGGGRR